MARRDPHTPDCAIRGCTRAARRLGMCTAHATPVPFSLSLQCMSESIMASHRVGRKYERRAQAIARKALRA